LKHVSQVPDAIQPKPATEKPLARKPASPAAKLTATELAQVVGGADLPSHGLDWRKKVVATLTAP
jgi:hypothetical protein